MDPQINNEMGQASNVPIETVLPVEPFTMLTGDTQFNEHEHINGNEIPPAATGSNGKCFLVPEFTVDIPKDMPFNCWADEILKKFRLVLDNEFENGRILSDLEERDILEPEQVQGAKEEPHDSGGIPIVRNKTAHGVSPQVEARDVDDEDDWSLEETMKLIDVVGKYVLEREQEGINRTIVLEELETHDEAWSRIAELYHNP